MNQIKISAKDIKVGDTIIIDDTEGTKIQGIFVKKYQEKDYSGINKYIVVQITETWENSRGLKIGKEQHFCINAVCIKHKLFYKIEA